MFTKNIYLLRNLPLISFRLIYSIEFEQKNGRVSIYDTIFSSSVSVTNSLRSISMRICVWPFAESISRLAQFVFSSASANRSNGVHDESLSNRYPPRYLWVIPLPHSYDPIMQKRITNKAMDYFESNFDSSLPMATAYWNTFVPFHVHTNGKFCRVPSENCKLPHANFDLFSFRPVFFVLAPEGIVSKKVGQSIVY